MSKDRAKPFSRKHRRVWIPVTGGMIAIGVVNLVLGFCTYDPGPSEPPQRIEYVIPGQDAGVLDSGPRLEQPAVPQQIQHDGGVDDQRH